MKSILKSLNLFVLWGYKVLRNLGAVALALMFLSITLGIITRYILNAPIPANLYPCMRISSGTNFRTT